MAYPEEYGGHSVIISPADGDDGRSMADTFTEETVEEETASPNLGGGGPKAAEAGTKRDKGPQPHGRRGTRCRRRLD